MAHNSHEKDCPSPERCSTPVFKDALEIQPTILGDDGGMIVLLNEEDIKGHHLPKPRANSPRAGAKIAKPIVGGNRLRSYAARKPSVRTVSETKQVVYKSSTASIGQKKTIESRTGKTAPSRPNSSRPNSSRSKSPRQVPLVVVTEGENICSKIILHLFINKQE